MEVRGVDRVVKKTTQRKPPGFFWKSPVKKKQ